MPAVIDLRGMRQVLGCCERMAASPTTRDDLDPWLIREPELRRIGSRSMVTNEDIGLPRLVA
jgi:hypothetical protein